MMKRIGISLCAAIVALGSAAQTPCEAGMALDWPCDQVDLWSFMPLDDIGGGDRTNDIWGWTDEESRREFALVGKDIGTAFVEITDPGNPIYLGDLPTATTAILWRDIKVFEDHAYIVSEAGDHGMQVFDLTNLLDVAAPPVTFESLIVYDGFGNAHNVVINEGSGFAYGVGTNTVDGGLHIIDIDVDEPEDLFLAGTFEEDGYTHDAQVVNYEGPDTDWGGKEIAFCCNNDAITIVDVSDKSDCEMISTSTYPNTGYTHQGWLSDDQAYFLFNDELDEMNFEQNTRTHVLDIQDLSDPEYIGYWEHDNTAIDHNMYNIGDLSFMSNYRSGLRLVDIAQVADLNFKQVGFFDVSPSNDNPSFSGSWSNYAWFKSGNVICTDMVDGFFILRPTVFVVDPPAVEVECGDDSQEFTVTVNSEIDGTFIVGQEGLPGSIQVVTDSFEAPGEVTLTFNNLTSLETGVYDFQFMFMTEFGSYPVWSSITVVGDLPEAPALNEPADDDDLDTTLPSFDWDDVPAATGYVFELSEFDDFNTTLIQETVDVSEFTAPFDLLPGTYYWRVKALNDCGDGEFASAFSFSITETAVPVEGFQEFTLFPNPANEVLNIRSPKVIGSISAYDSQGRVVLQDFVTSATTLVNVSEWASGIYTIVLGTESYLVEIR